MKTRKLLKRALEDPRHGPDSALVLALEAQLRLEEEWPSLKPVKPKPAKPKPEKPSPARKIKP